MSRRLINFKIVPGSNLLQEKGRIKNLAAKMRITGLTLGYHIFCAIFVSALLAEDEVEPGTWHLATVSAENESSRLSQNGVNDFLETLRRGRTQAIKCTRPTVPMSAAGEVEAAREGKVDGDGQNMDEGVEAPTRAVVA